MTSSIRGLGDHPPTGGAVVRLHGILTGAESVLSICRLNATPALKRFSHTYWAPPMPLEESCD